MIFCAAAAPTPSSFMRSPLEASLRLILASALAWLSPFPWLSPFAWLSALSGLSSAPIADPPARHHIATATAAIHRVGFIGSSFERDMLLWAISRSAGGADNAQCLRQAPCIAAWTARPVAGQ